MAKSSNLENKIIGQIQRYPGQRPSEIIQAVSSGDRSQERIAESTLRNLLVTGTVNLNADWKVVYSTPKVKSRGAI